MSGKSTHAQQPGRLLRLLVLLQSRREWSGRALAERLDVTERTVRRDIGRLRALDYLVESTTGNHGGYRLATGRKLPPLALEDDEAVAVATVLVAAPNTGLDGVEDSSARALAKLEQMLPTRLRPQVRALTGTAAAVPHAHSTPPVDPGVLATIASCCRECEVLSFDYRGRDGATGLRRVQPHNLVTAQGFWYLLAHDPERDDWRTFRVDRITAPTRTYRHFTPRELAASDAAGHLTWSFANAQYQHTARLTVELAAETLRAGLFGPLLGEIEESRPRQCTVRLSADSAELVVHHIAAVAALGAEFTVDASEEITRRVRELGRRLAEQE